MKSPKIRTLSLLFGLLAAVTLLMRCGSNGEGEKEKGEDKPQPTDQKIPSTWDGLSDWTESPWQLEDE